MPAEAAAAAASAAALEARLQLHFILCGAARPGQSRQLELPTRCWYSPLAGGELCGRAEKEESDEKEVVPAQLRWQSLTRLLPLNARG
jgi:hypothetical protein